MCYSFVQVTTVVFDKTGTLTTGKPSITGVISLNQEWTTDRVSRVRGKLFENFLTYKWLEFLQGCYDLFFPL